MTKYIVSRFETSPVEPQSASEFSTLAEARTFVRRHTTARCDSSLADERYDDGTWHVSAYYDDDHQSSGWWITTTQNPHEANLFASEVRSKIKSAKIDDYYRIGSGWAHVRSTIYAPIFVGDGAVICAGAIIDAGANIVANATVRGRVRAGSTAMGE